MLFRSYIAGDNIPGARTGLCAEQALCQVLESPDSPERLVPNVPELPDVSDALRQASRDGEIRLTYGELTALIADAVKNLRD